MQPQKADLLWFFNSLQRKSSVPIDFARTLACGVPSLEEIQHFNSTEFDIEQDWKQLNKRSLKCFDACVYIRLQIMYTEQPDPRLIEIMFERFGRKLIMERHRHNLKAVRIYRRWLLDNFILKKYLIHCRNKPKPSLDFGIFKIFMDVCRLVLSRNNWYVIGCNLVFESYFFCHQRSGQKMLAYLIKWWFKLRAMPEKNLFDEVYTIDFNERMANSWLLSILYFSHEKILFQSPKVSVGRINASNIQIIKFSDLKTTEEMRYLYAHYVLVRKTSVIKLSLYQHSLLKIAKTANDGIVSETSPLPEEMKRDVLQFNNFLHLLPVEPVFT